MFANFTAGAVRLRLLATRGMTRLGLREETFYLLLAAVIGIIAAAAAVLFHEMIVRLREVLFATPGESFLYGRGMFLLVLIPTLGGLAVGVLSKVVFHVRGIHGLVDVMESVIRLRGFIRPLAAVEKILTSGITIGTGGSVGAEAPIVQIGAAIASGVGRLFGIAGQHMPLLIGCGSAAGISAIFNAPIGGVLFTLEVILGDFSLRTFSPLVVASVIANVTTQAILKHVVNTNYDAIFSLDEANIRNQVLINWGTVPHYILLGLACGLVAATFTRLLLWSEHAFDRLPAPPWTKPAMGGLGVGLLGVAYILFFSRPFLHADKPIPFHQYPMPAFFSDGYGAIQPLLLTTFYQSHGGAFVLAVCGVLCLVKLMAASLTVSSGGGGGVIGPALFLGAVAGGFFGVLYRLTGHPTSQPEISALVGMAAVLAATIHAPMASIVILFELTHDYKLTLPAMLATVAAVGFARLVFPDSIYSIGLRQRGLQAGESGDLRLLQRLNVEQIELDPMIGLKARDPVSQLLGRIDDIGVTDFVVTDDAGAYTGMVMADDVVAALREQDVAGILLVQDLLRTDIRPVCSTDDLASVLDRFATHNVEHLPVTTERSPMRVIGMVSRENLLRRYQKGLGTRG